MTVNSSAFVEPTITRGGIYAHQQHVAATRGREVGQIETERIVSSGVVPDVEVVECHHGFAIRTIKFHRDAFARIFSRQLKDAPIPADARGWILFSQRVETLRSQCRIVLERQLDSPVMRQVERMPCAVVKGKSAGRNEVSRFLEIAVESEVFCGIAGMPKLEAPAKI